MYRMLSVGNLSLSIATLYISVSQTCSNRYPNQGSDSVLLPSIKIFSYFRSKISSAVITHNTEQHCGFGSALPIVESHITPRG